jgi:hypothetical protein
MDEQELVAKSWEAYADIQSDRQTIGMHNILPSPARFLHRDYLCEDGGASKEKWESWVCKDLGVTSHAWPAVARVSGACLDDRGPPTVDSSERNLAVLVGEYICGCQIVAFGNYRRLRRWEQAQPQGHISQERTVGKVSRSSLPSN